MLYRRARDLTEGASFHSLVTTLVVATALTAGLEAFEPVQARWGEALWRFQEVAQVLFAAEIALRILAAGPTFRDFLRDGWNRFDLAVVVLSFAPVVGGFAVLARLLRVLRLLRLVSAFQGLRDVVDDGGATAGVAGPLAAVLGIGGYTFAIAGHVLFHPVDPAHWGGLFEALRSVLFLAVVTDVDGIAGPATDAHPTSLLFFAVFYLCLATALLHAVGQGVAAHLRARGAS